MSELAALWMPIFLSSIAVFFASFLAWVVIGHHTPDWRGMRLVMCRIPSGSELIAGRC